MSTINLKIFYRRTMKHYNQSYRGRKIQYLSFMYKKGEIKLKTIGGEFKQAKLENPNMHHDRGST